jgi:hypothetical protein
MQTVSAEPITIRFIGFTSKKNRKAPRKGGRGLYLEPKTRTMIDRMELQVPAEVRDLNLEHPDMIWEFQYTNAHIDRDGIITTVLDILGGPCRVIKNDNIAHCNGTWTIYPAERGEYDMVEVTLIPQGSNVGQEAVQHIPLKEHGAPTGRTARS